MTIPLVCGINSIMNKKVIVTNLRVEEEDWNQLKAVAAERGMSANEYINYLMKNVVTEPFLFGAKKSKSVWKLPELSKKAKARKKFDLSEDDKLIYEE